MNSQSHSTASHGVASLEGCHATSDRFGTGWDITVGVLEALPDALANSGGDE